MPTAVVGCIPPLDDELLPLLLLPLLLLPLPPLLPLLLLPPPPLLLALLLLVFSPLLLSPDEFPPPSAPLEVVPASQADKIPSEQRARNDLTKHLLPRKRSAVRMWDLRKICQ